MMSDSAPEIGRKKGHQDKRHSNRFIRWMFIWNKCCPTMIINAESSPAIQWFVKQNRQHKCMIWIRHLFPPTVLHHTVTDTCESLQPVCTIGAAQWPAGRHEWRSSTRRVHSSAHIWRWSWSMNQELVTIKSYHTTVANRSVSGIKRGDPFGVNTAARPHRLLWRVPWTGFWEAAEPCSPPAWFPGPSDLSDTP